MDKSFALGWVLAAFSGSLFAQPADLDLSASPMRPYIEAFSADRVNLLRYYNVELAGERSGRLQRFYTQWRERLATIDFDRMPIDGKVDYVVFRNHLDHELKRLDFVAKSVAETAAYIPFAPMIIDLEEARRRTEPMKGQDAAARLTQLTAAIEKARQAAEQMPGNAVRRTLGFRALNEVTSLRNTLRFWFAFYDNYDPLFTWWAAGAYKSADAALQTYSAYLREKVALLPPAVENADARQSQSGTYSAAAAAGARAGASNDIIGSPIGRDALMSELSLRDDPLHAGRADRHRLQRTRLVRERDEARLA